MMDLMTMWKQARGEVALPDPAYVRSTPPQFYKDDWTYQKFFSADQMRAIATPGPETLKRFAEMVAEECARVAHDFGTGGPLYATAIRRHVKGE